MNQLEEFDSSEGICEHEQVHTEEPQGRRWTGGANRTH